MNWEPAHADHSIETVNVTLTFSSTLHPDIFDEMLVAARKAASAHQFSRRVEGFEPIEIKAPEALGQEVVINVSQSRTRRRVGFQRVTDGNVIGDYSVSASSMSVTTARYSSWQDFLRMVGDLLKPMQDTAGVLEQIKSIQLQYVDRFRSNSVGADAFEVIRKTSSHLVPAVAAKTRAFHSHSGWFDYLDEKTRRLTNVNVDLVDNSPPEAADALSKLGILTMARLDDLSQGALNNPLDELNRLHYYLKELFADIISEDAAERVHLND